MAPLALRTPMMRMLGSGVAGLRAGAAARLTRQAVRQTGALLSSVQPQQRGLSTMVAARTGDTTDPATATAAASSSLNPVNNINSNTKTLSLKLSNPAAFLNVVASRYASTPRIVMEYVDNALDDAEELLRAAGGSSYPNVQIRIRIDRAARSIYVSDNCRGMSPEQLRQLVGTIGESRKKGVPWLNGQFGFGLHAFRAAAYELSVFSKMADQPLYAIAFSRDQYEGIKIPTSDIAADVAAATGIGASGTLVQLKGFDAHWWKEVSVQAIRTEIERHFERLLTRPGLEVTVFEGTAADQSTAQRCKPFDYSQIKGNEVQKSFTVGEGQRQHTINIHLKVAELEYTKHTARFFLRGRRVCEVGGTPSFMKLSTHRESLWNHPQLVGYVDLNDALEPVITRDEFTASETRDAVYEKLVALEPELMEHLQAEVEKQRVNTLTKLEDILSGVMQKVMKEEKRAEQKAAIQQQPPAPVDEAPPSQSSPEQQQPEQPPAAADAAQDAAAEQRINQALEPKKNKREKKNKEEKKPKLDIEVHFASLPVDADGKSRRAMVAGDTITINTNHPDFQSRLVKTKVGKPTLSPSLVSYISTVVATYYRERRYALTNANPDRETIYEHLLSSCSRVEALLRRYQAKIVHSIRDDVKS